MKVILELPTPGIGANVKAFDLQGNEVTISRLEIEPLFYAARSMAPLLYGRVRAVRGEADDDVASDEEVETHRFVVGVSGVTALCKLSNRSQPRMSSFESGDDKE